MSELTITHHVIDRLTGIRPLMSVSTLHKVAQHISEIVDQFDPNTIHQVAVQVHTFDTPRKLGKSEGDCLIIPVDIRKRTIPTCFLRYARQGKPKMASVMIDMNGNII
jgi:hypothetical protein